MVVHARTPLRISFGGGGTDVEPFASREGGLVLNATIDRYIYGELLPDLTARRSKVIIDSRDYGISVEFEPGAWKKDGNLDLAKAAIERALPKSIRACEVQFTIASSAPPGSGLGSSSALCVTLIALLNHWGNRAMTDYEIADMASRIEREDMGIQGGLQDYYAATFGGFNLMAFSGGDEVLVTPLRLSPQVISELEMNLMLVYTGISRRSDEVIADQVTRTKDLSSKTNKALKVQKTITRDMVTALLKARVTDFGGLLHEAWLQKRLFSPKVSNERIDHLMDIGMKNGAIGGKITGAGGGGYILLYVPFEHRQRCIDAYARVSDGLRAEPVHFTSVGAQAWRWE